VSAITEAVAVIRQMAYDLKQSNTVAGTDTWDPIDPGAEREYRYLLDLAERLEAETRSDR